MSDLSKVREASHCGSWYSANAAELESQLDEWLQKAGPKSNSVRAVISPHAGYSYCGATAAFAHKNIDKSKVKRVFILGPSHHVYSPKCSLSMMNEYQTPFGKMTLDKEVIEELHATGKFEYMRKSIDEDEHSIEMQLPYVAKLMQGINYTVVPIMVGSTKPKSEDEYGAIFAKYLQNEENFFVISRHHFDFCHWGKRFDYYFLPGQSDPIFKGIEELDRAGMDAIETQDPGKFYDYLDKTDNTICGRHPIGILLQAMKHSGLKFETKFIAYAQSNRCNSKKDSSVSYAAGVVTQQ